MATQEVLITPASGKIEFKSTSGGTLYSTIKDIDGVLYLLPTSTVVFGDGTPANVELGGAGTPVSLTYLGGGILSSSGNTLNIGASGDTINLNASGVTYQFPSSLSLNISGNASTATALQTPRTVGLSGKITAPGVAFDGAANIIINSTSAAILSSEITDATSANIANTVIRRDSSGSFFAQDLTLAGDLTVNGTTTTINSTTISVDDKNIELGAVTTPTDATADGGGITLRGSTDKTITWDNTNGNWTSNQSWNLSSGLNYKINNVSVLNATTLGSSVITSSLTTVGTIGTGTWQGTSIKTGYGGTGLTSYTVGDMLYWSSGVSMTALPIGASGQILRSTGTAPVWSTPTFPNTATSGKFLYANGTNWIESTSTIPTSAGSTAGKYLVSDGTNYVLSSYTITLGANTTINTSVANYVAYYSGTNTISGEQYLSVSRGGTGAGTFTASAILVGNTTSAIQAPGPTLTSTTLSFTGAGIINSATTNALTLDSTSTGAINIGNNANAKTITIGNTTGATSVVINSGTAGVTFNQVASSVFKVSASAAPTTDMMQITNTGQNTTTAGVNALQINYFAGSTTVANENSAIRTEITPIASIYTGSIINAIRIIANTAIPTAGAVGNGIKWDTKATGSGTSNAMWIGTGWDNILNYNNTSLINGAGEMYTTKMSVSLWKIQQDGTTNSLKFIYN